MNASNNDALREFAFNVGAEHGNIGYQWLLHDSDTWVKNPHYTGPEQMHPDDYTYDQGDLDDHWDFDADDGQALVSAGFGIDEDYGGFSDMDDY